MSDPIKNSSPKTNEDIIDELTQGLESSLKTSEEGSTFYEVPLPSSSERTDAKKTGVHGDFDDVTDFEKHEDETAKDEDTVDSDTDSLDEVKLKDAELDMTDDEKAERTIIAEELKEAGNNLFKLGDYEKSEEKYTKGLEVCPLQFAKQRSVLFCNRSAARTKLKMYKKAIRDCNRAVELDEQYTKAYLRRATCYELSDKLDEALADYKKVLELDTSVKQAQEAVRRLPPIIEQRNEKLKTEMLGKLKDLGNIILKPFGLSTDNFQMEQDPESKGYKINFKQ